MTLTRRDVLGGLAAAGVIGVPGALRASIEGPVAWRNWSGGQMAHPVARFAPASEDELIAFLSRGRGALRPVGAGHSFSPLVPTDGQLLVLDRLSGRIGHDPVARTATFGAGTRMTSMGPELDAIGQAAENLADIDVQTLAGALSTATHGTGVRFGSIASTVTALRLVTPAGAVLDLDSTDPRFDAARVSLGALGIITRVTLAHVAPFRLKKRVWLARLDEVLDGIDARAREHRHFELFPLVHSDWTVVQTLDETDEAPVPASPAVAASDAAFGEAMAGWAGLPVDERPAAIDAFCRDLPPQDPVIDDSWRLLANVRLDRFNEMEYEVPASAGPDALRGVLDTIRRERIDVAFPLEYRYVRGDTPWLSMFHERDSASISVHQFAGLDWRPYFDRVEPVLRDFGGRPHWGKLHSLGHAALVPLYPRLGDFLAVREQLDPEGRLLNGHLRSLFGIGA